MKAITPAAAILASSALLIGSPATAQTITKDIPILDNVCVSPAITVPPCQVNGTYQTTVVSQTITPAFGGSVFLDGTYNVRFNGIASSDDVPGNSADISTSYTGTIHDGPLPPSLISAGQISHFNQYDLHDLTLNSLTASYSEYSIGGVSYSVSSPAGAPVINNNSVLVQGGYQQTTADALIFGKVQGVATLTPVLTTQALFNSAPLETHFVLDSFTETTRLDESGLTAPTVSVSQGINMNGSKVTNLAAGTAPTDAVNVAQLNQEVTTRQAVDNTLAQGLASETASRLATDTAQSNRLDALTAQMSHIDSRLDRLDKRASAGTAVAIAMGGASFLPGMRFNLTANVSTYQGQHAGAIQFGAMVTPHAAANAAVATSFGQNGGTGARAGFTVGW